MDTLGDRLLEVMRELRIESPRELAKFCNVSEGLVSQWFSGQTKLGPKPLLAFSKTQFSIEWLSTGKLPKYSPRPDIEIDELNGSNVEPGPNIIMSKPLPISGEIQGGDNGYLDIQQFPEGYAEGCVMHPVRSPNCYALRVRGDSMHPRIKHREIIVIDPNHDLKEGDEVVVHLQDGRQMVKVFLYERDGEISLGSINDKHPPISVKQSEIKEMHFVAAILPIGSVCKKA